MRDVAVAVVQMSCGPDLDENLDRAESHVRAAAGDDATLILLPELFDGPYFPKVQSGEYFDRAFEIGAHPSVLRMQTLARELGVVLPVSFFERAGQTHFNSIAIIDGDGAILGNYRKSHIPDGPGYTEKFYFSPGDTGFRVWDTQAGRIGVAICWDQWFPEAARIMTLQGAEVLLYPTAIGSEPMATELDSSGAWQRVMQGHAAANCVPVVAANRHGREAESGDAGAIDFYGSSFLADHQGQKLAEAGRQEDAVLVSRFDLDEISRYRDEWGLFRDRRPDLYGPLLSFDGSGGVAKG